MDEPVIDYCRRRYGFPADVTDSEIDEHCAGSLGEAFGNLSVAIDNLSVAIVTALPISVRAFLARML